MRTTVRHGHYVPASYLEGFTDPAPSGRKPSQLWAYSRSDSRWFNTAPKNVAKAGLYYVVRNAAGKWTNDLEGQFSDIEETFQAILHGRILRYEHLSDDERACVATFLALQRVRVPAHHDWWERCNTDLAKFLLRLSSETFKCHPDDLEAFKEECRQSEGADLVDSLTAEALDPEGLSFRVDRSWKIRSSLAQVDVVARHVFQMNWPTARAPGRCYYITSDDPFGIFNPTLRPGQGVGLIQPDVEIVFPLTRDHALIAGWKMTERSCVLADRRLVRQVNLRTAHNSMNFVFAPIPAFEGSDEIDWLVEPKPDG